MTLLANSLHIFVRAGEEWGGAGTLAVALWIRQQYQICTDGATHLECQGRLNAPGIINHQQQTGFYC